MKTTSRALKNLIQSAKALRGLNRVPNGAPTRPKDPKAAAHYDTYWANNPTVGSLRELISAPAFDETRRARS